MIINFYSFAPQILSTPVGFSTSLIGLTTPTITIFPILSNNNQTASL